MHLSVLWKFHLRRKKKSTMIQTRWRIYCDRRRFLDKKVAAVSIQTMVRGSLQRPKYRQALIDKKEEAKLENQLIALQRKLEEAEAKRIEAEKQAEIKAAAAVKQYKEEKESQESQSEDSKNENKTNKEVTAQEEEATVIIDDQTTEQQKLMDESGKMLEYLRKEVFKLRGQNQQLRTDFNLLKDNNQRLMDANASAGASFAALNQHAKQLSKQNTRLVNDVTSFKNQVQKLNMLQVELKEELRMKQATYVGEVQSRLQYQKALQKITDLIEGNCRDHRLVQKVLAITDEVEMEFLMSSGDNRDSVDQSETSAMNESQKSGFFSYLNPFS